MLSVVVFLAAANKKQQKDLSRSLSGQAAAMVGRRSQLVVVEDNRNDRLPVVLLFKTIYHSRIPSGNRISTTEFGIAKNGDLRETEICHFLLNLSPQALGESDRAGRLPLFPHLLAQSTLLKAHWQSTTSVLATEQRGRSSLIAICSATPIDYRQRPEATTRKGPRNRKEEKKGRSPFCSPIGGSYQAVPASSIQSIINARKHIE